jgi:glucan phosphoethanolaminetransferase (alkaline phosphatase superfamily)
MFTEWLFLISFLAVMGLTLFKAYNVARVGRVVTIYLSLVFYILILLFWFTGLQVLFSSPETLIYTMLHRLMSIFLLFSTLMVFAELVMATLLVMDGKGRVKFKDF